MAEEERVVHLRDDFYRDGFYKMLLALVTIIAAIVFLIAIAVYFYLAKPPPHFFKTDNELRVLPPVPVNEPYLSVPDLTQWVSNSLPKVFTYDFVNYTKQLKENTPYFTTNGWNKFLEHVNVYANYNTVHKLKLFINTNASGAPFILNQGLIEGRYAWWLQVPIEINYITAEKRTTESIVIQVLVVRVPTLNNLSGVGIENMIITKGGGNKPRTQ